MLLGNSALVVNVSIYLDMSWMIFILSSYFFVYLCNEEQIPESEFYVSGPIFYKLGPLLSGTVMKHGNG